MRLTLGMDNFKSKLEPVCRCIVGHKSSVVGLLFLSFATPVFAHCRPGRCCPMDKAAIQANNMLHSAKTDKSLSTKTLENSAAKTGDGPMIPCLSICPLHVTRQSQGRLTIITITQVKLRSLFVRIGLALPPVCPEEIFSFLSPLAFFFMFFPVAYSFD